MQFPTMLCSGSVQHGIITMSVQRLASGCLLHAKVAPAICSIAQVPSGIEQQYHFVHAGSNCIGLASHTMIVAQGHSKVGTIGPSSNSNPSKTQGRYIYIANGPDASQPPFICRMPRLTRQQASQFANAFKLSQVNVSMGRHSNK